MGLDGEGEKGKFTSLLILLLSGHIVYHIAFFLIILIFLYRLYFFTKIFGSHTTKSRRSQRALPLTHHPCACAAPQHSPKVVQTWRPVSHPDTPWSPAICGWQVRSWCCAFCRRGQMCKDTYLPLRDRIFALPQASSVFCLCMASSQPLETTGLFTASIAVPF